MFHSLLQYLLLCFVLLLFVHLFDKHLTGISILLLFWTVVEAVLGVLQACGYGGVSHHLYYVIIGSFGDPGTYGALIAVGMAVAAAVAWRQYVKKNHYSSPFYCLSLATLALGLIVLPASRSRAAWVGLIVAVLVLLLCEADLPSWIRKHRLAAVGILASILLASAGAFFMKQDSAIGRFHIWNVECRAIAEHPWEGVGIKNIFKAYGDAQAAYFQETERPRSIIRVAGSPTYAYNEYLKFGMAWGIPGLILSFAVALFVILRLFKRHSPLAYGAIVYAVFAFASFPLSVAQLKVLGTVLLASALVPEKAGHSWIFWLVGGLLFCASIVACIILYPQEKARRDAERVWKRSPYLKQNEYDLSVYKLQPLYPRLKDSYKYLFDYGYSLHKIGEFEKSNHILHQGADISCDPIFHTIIAKNHIALGQYEEAETELINAHWLIPCRIYPLLLMMRLYADTGRTEDAIDVGRTIERMPVYERNPNMRRLQGEAMSLMSELQKER